MPRVVTRAVQESTRSGWLVPDVVSSATRSRMMAGIRSGNTRPEMVVRRHLHSAGFRYRLQYAKLPGRPDIVLPKHKAVVFVHGCFWHAHQPCPYFRLPESRVEFWTAKLNGNKARDDRIVAELLDAGWRVAIIWECYTRRPGADLTCLDAWILDGPSTLVLE